MLSNKQKTYRENGAIGALLDEYEKAIIELILLIQYLPQTKLIKIVDPNTQDEDCRSIHTILNHVISAGYNYVKLIRKWLGEQEELKENLPIQSIPQAIVGLETMFAENVKLFADYPNISLEEFDPSKKIKSPWGPLYDVESMFEHAIVHVLRHRRQIERFLIKLNQESVD